MSSTPYTVTDVVSTVVTPNAVLGNSTSDGVSFYGATPIPQTNAALTNTAFGTLAAYVTGTAGLDTGAHMQALYNQVVALNAALIALGLIVV